MAVITGLVAAGYFAKAGLKVIVLERRPVVGGAAVSEHPFGADYTVSTLSYAVSGLPAAMIRDLELAKHGYHVYTQGPYFAPRADGRYLWLPDDPTARFEEIKKFSPKDAESYPLWHAWLAQIGTLLGPLRDEIPPAIGSHRLSIWPGQRGCCASCGPWTYAAPLTSPGS